MYLAFIIFISVLSAASVAATLFILIKSLGNKKATKAQAADKTATPARTEEADHLANIVVAYTSGKKEEKKRLYNIVSAYTESEAEEKEQLYSIIQNYAKGKKEEKQYLFGVISAYAAGKEAAAKEEDASDAEA